MNQIETFRNLSTADLVTNPFFIEWIYWSGRNSGDLLPDRKIDETLQEISIQNAKDQLLRYSDSCPLINNSLIQFRLMKGEIASLKNDHFEPRKEIELSFQIANLYWSVIKENLGQYSFTQGDHEIQFFKFIKPAFTGEIEFISLAYHALLFSADTPKELEIFWKREKQRKEKLRQENLNFFSHYLDGSTRHDKEWFTRRDESASSSFDHLVASWYALEKYNVIIEKALQLQPNLFK